MARHRWCGVGCRPPTQVGHAAQGLGGLNTGDGGHGVLLCVEKGNAHPRRGQGPRLGKLRAGRSGDRLAQMDGLAKVKACIHRHRPSLDAGQHELPQHAVGIGTRSTTLTGHQTMANRHGAGCYEAGNDCDASELDSRAAGTADEGLADAMSTGATSVWGDGHPSTTCDSDCHARTPLRAGVLGVQVFACPPMMCRCQ